MMGAEEAGRRNTSCTVSTEMCLMDDTVKVKGVARSSAGDEDAEEEAVADVGEAVEGGEGESEGAMRLIVKVGGDEGGRDEADGDDMSLIRGRAGVWLC